jgi:S-DNA-T family DNA segregation ATPase FtsK/SpoIIIE
VASRTDSRVVLDEMGADKLLGNGDLLFLWPGTSTLLRGQGTYLSDDEINRVVDFVGTTEPQFAKELVALKPKSDNDGKGVNLKNRDELYEGAVDVVIREGRGSVSLLQRALGIGYGRAARLIDYMAEDGIVGEYNGSQARDVLITLEQWAEMQGEKPDPEPQPTRPKLNRILPARDDESDSDDDDFDDEPPFDDGGGDDDDDEDSDDESEDTLPVRGPHRFGTAGGRSAASAHLEVDTEQDFDREDDEEEETSEEDDEPDDQCDDAEQNDVETDSDDRYANINPALLARLRAKRLQDRQRRLRRSA